MIRLALLAGLGAVLGLQPGCRSWFQPEKWQDLDAEYDVEFSILWNVVKLSLSGQFETLEYERSAEGVLVTGWDLQLSQLPGDGYREQAHIRVVKGDRGYRVYVRVAREANDEPIYTLDPRHARWRAVDDDVERAQHLVGLIHAKMRSVIGY